MSCIDLIFCTNQSVISNHGVDVSIFDKCHHNIIYGKINIRVSLALTYVREVWDYEKANIENFKTLLNIFRNYIPNKKIKCDYRQPPWMTDIIKNL